jgi:hypothetical protein
MCRHWRPRSESRHGRDVAIEAGDITLLHGDAVRI